MSQPVPRLESLQSPILHGAENDNLAIKSYGIGVDCHSRFYAVCLRINRDGEFDLREWDVPARVPDLIEAKEEVLETLLSAGVEVEWDDLHYTCESSGPYHKPLLNAWVGKPSVVNPLLAGSTRRKTDRLDARLLSFHDITGLWESTFVMPHQYEQARHYCRASLYFRDYARLMKQKITTLTTMYGHTVASLGPVIRSDVRGLIEDLASGVFNEHENLNPNGVPPLIGNLIMDYYAQHDEAVVRQKTYFRTFKAIVDENNYTIPATGEVVKGKQVAKRLLTIPGIGENSAYILLSEIADISRFSNARAFVAYCGFDPSLKVSAGKVTQHVRRRGNLIINNVMKSAVASTLMKHSEPFGRWAYIYSKKHKKGGFRKATSALARKCVTAAYHVWWNNADFSYEGYNLDEYEGIKTSKVIKSQLPPKVKNILLAHGYHDSHHVVDKLDHVFQLPGIGEKSIKEINLWLFSLKGN